MEHIHTTYHTPLTTTKTNSVQKDKIKPYIQHLRYPYTSENTEIQLTPVNQSGQDESLTVLLSFPKLMFNHFRAESLCTYRALFRYLVNAPKTARSQVQTTQLYSKPTVHPYSTANSPYPQCYMSTVPHRQKYITRCLCPRSLPHIPVHN